MSLIKVIYCPQVVGRISFNAERDLLRAMKRLKYADAGSNEKEHRICGIGTGYVPDN